MDAPAWLVPPSWAPVMPAAVTDAIWIAVQRWREAGDPRAGGVAATVAWVCRTGPAPVTGRTELPGTSALAESERVAAQLVLDEALRLPRFPAEAYCAELGVVFVEPRPVSVGWAEGVHATLRWVLGRQGVDGLVGPPIPLPDRRADGTLITAEEVYEREVARGGAALGPEQRAELRRQAEVAEEQSRRLAARVQELQRAASDR